MRLLLPALSLAAFAAMPVSAAGLAETHREVAVPAGKIHAKAFRPLAPQPCAAQQANPSGSRPAATQAVRMAKDCPTAEAARRS